MYNVSYVYISDITKRYDERWGRPEMDTSKDITFQQIDLDKYIDYSNGEPKAVIRMYGVNEEGASVVCHVVNFKPYFFIRAPVGFTPDYCGQFVKTLNAKILDQIKQGNQFKGLNTAVISAELCKKENIYGYTSKGKENFIKITLALQTLMTPSKKVVEAGFEVETSQGNKKEQFSTFESNIDFEVRFMVDTGIKGASWVTLPKGKYGPRLDKAESTCSYDCVIDYKYLIAHEPVDEWSKTAPLRILSYDIECAGRKGIFPEPEHDPVIQIAAMVQRQGL